MEVLFLNGKWTNLQYILVVTLLIASLYGDMIKNKTLACPTVLLLQKAKLVDLQDPLQLEMYSIANGCVVLTRGEQIEAVGYDPRNSKEIYQKILYKQTNNELYILRDSIDVEQGGKKNIYRF